MQKIVRSEKFEYMGFSHADIYRGISALQILLHHIGCVYAIRALTPLGGMGVAVFLISSGYGLNESFASNPEKNRSIGSYWGGKTVRVVIPYLMVCIIALFAKTVFTSIAPPNWYNWYLFCLLEFYLLWYLIITIPGAYRWKYPILIICGIIMLFFAHELQAEQAFSFFIGVLISDRCHQKKERMLYSNLFIASTFFIGVMFLAIKQFEFVRDFAGTPIFNAIQMCIKVPLALCLIAVTYRLQNLCNNVFFAWVGKASYEIYLVQAQAFWILSDNLITLIPFFAFVFGFTELLYVIDLRLGICFKRKQKSTKRSS